MAEVKKKVEKAAAPEGAVATKTNRPTDAVDVKNITNRIINTSMSSIKPGEVGKSSNAELRRWGKFLEKA